MLPLLENFSRTQWDGASAHQAHPWFLTRLPSSHPVPEQGADYLDGSPSFSVIWKDVIRFSSVTQLCLTLWYPRDCCTPDFPVHHQLKLMSIESVMPSNHLILWRSIFLPPSIFPSIRVFSNKSVLHIRWPKYWSFSFSINTPNEYSGLISLE